MKISRPEDLPKLREFMEQNDLKINKSEIARQLNMDRKTVSKYLKGFQKSEHRKKGSEFDKYYDIIFELLNSETQVFHYRSILYRYLVDNYNLNHPAISFYHYLKTVPEFENYFIIGKISGKSSNPVIRYETAPGMQAQLDWKEKIPFVLKNSNETISVNVLTLIMGMSRLKVYKLALNTSRDVLLHLITESFESIGGVPHTILTDNMKTVMDEARTLNKPGVINREFETFAKDFGFELKPCVAATPMTKGKVESQMKFLDEIQAYSGKLNLIELCELIERINRRVNYSICQGTGKIPIIEFEKEKDSLLPLPHESIRNQYHIKTVSAKVNTAGMISIHSNQYSVPYTYIGKNVEYQIHDSNVYVYSNTKLIAVHRLSDKKLNYTSEHYSQVLSLKFVGKDSDEVISMAKQNLKIIGGVYSNE